MCLRTMFFHFEIEITANEGPCFCSLFKHGAKGLFHIQYSEALAMRIKNKKIILFFPRDYLRCPLGDDTVFRSDWRWAFWLTDAPLLVSPFPSLLSTPLPFLHSHSPWPSSVLSASQGPSSSICLFLFLCFRLSHTHTQSSESYSLSNCQAVGVGRWGNASWVFHYIIISSPSDAVIQDDMVAQAAIRGLKYDHLSFYSIPCFQVLRVQAVLRVQDYFFLLVGTRERLTLWKPIPLEECTEGESWNWKIQQPL